MGFYDILLARNLSGGGGGDVTPESIVTATGEMTEAQAAQTRENIGAGEPLSPQDIADAAGNWLEDNLATPSTPPIDASLSVANAAADAKATGDALAEKADTDGEYDTLTAGVAKQLKSTVGITDNAPYLFRTAGGSADIGDLEMDKLVGGTVCWNQLIRVSGGDVGTTTKYGITFVRTSDGKCVMNGTTTARGHAISYSVKNIKGHKYILFSNSNQNIGVYLSSQSYGSDDKHRGKIIINSAANATWYYSIYLGVNAGTEITNLVMYPEIFDLTAMFGATVANYIYSIEAANAGAGIAFFKKLFPKFHYSYNAGTLLSVKALSHDMVGFNAYNNTTGQAKVVGGNVYQITGAYTALSFDGETVTPDADGYFTPSQSGILTVTGGNATTTCVHLKWDGEKDGEWEPYVKHSYPLDSDLELRGIPMLDINSELYYDGDTYENDGTVTRKFGIRAYQEGDVTDGVDMVTDGTNTVYRLTTPTTEQATPFQNPQQVDDFGTEEYVDTRTVPLPVGHNTFYQANLRAKLEMSPDSPDGDGDYIVRQTDGENKYVPLVVQSCMMVAAQSFTISPGVSVTAGATYNTYSLDLAVETQSGYTAAFAYITSCNGSNFAIVKAEITDGVLDATVCNIGASAETLTEINAQIIYTRTA